MFWRRRPTQPDLPVEDGPVTDAEIEAQLEAELAAREPSGAGPEGADREPAGPQVELAEPERARPEPPAGAEIDADAEEVPASAASSAGAPLAAGIERSRGGFMARLKGILGRGDPDEQTWEEVEETLIAGDLGREPDWAPHRA